MSFDGPDPARDEDHGPDHLGILYARRDFLLDFISAQAERGDDVRLERRECDALTWAITRLTGVR
jgi:hypothetical protein